MESIHFGCAHKPSICFRISVTILYTDTYIMHANVQATETPRIQWTKNAS